MLFYGNIAMRDFSDKHGLWAVHVTALKSKRPAKELDMNQHTLSSNSHEVANLSRFSPKLEHCNGNDFLKLHNHLKQYKLKIRGLGINPDSNKVVVVLVSSFTCKLGDRASDHSFEIYDMKTMDERISYVRVSF